jgi:hypothetical protein
VRLSSKRKRGVSRGPDPQVIKADRSVSRCDGRLCAPEANASVNRGKTRVTLRSKVFRMMRTDLDLASPNVHHAETEETQTEA